MSQPAPRLIPGLSPPQVQPLSFTCLPLGTQLLVHQPPPGPPSPSPGPSVADPSAFLPVHIPLTFTSLCSSSVSTVPHVSIVVTTNQTPLTIHLFSAPPGQLPMRFPQLCLFWACRQQLRAGSNSTPSTDFKDYKSMPITLPLPGSPLGFL